MNRKDIQGLRVHCGYPAITIVMQCDKKNVQNALVKILTQLTDSDMATVVRQKSTDLLTHFSCPLQNIKIALFIDKHRARSFIVPEATPDIIACDTTFKLDAIQNVLNRTFRYWVIDCTSEQPILLEGMADLVNELANTCTTFSDAACTLEHNKNSCFDDCFNAYLEQDKLPIVIVGNAQQTLRLRLLAPYTDLVIARVENRSDVWPVVQRWHAAEIEKMLKTISTDMPNQDYVADINDILTYARQGMVKKLVIEESYARPGCEHPVTRAVLFNKNCPTDYVAISVIEQIIESVRSKGGSVLIIPDSSLSDYARMIAFLWQR